MTKLMKLKKAFTNKGLTAVDLPAKSGIGVNDKIKLTVVGIGKVLVELVNEKPDQSHPIAKRSK